MGSHEREMRIRFVDSNTEARAQNDCTIICSEREQRAAKQNETTKTHLMQCVSALWDDMWLLSR